ncbi:CBS domain-containing protein [Laspinema sp. D1]|uniref:histidine kinase n=1 Tax=Laspinema palackyanum D2a TaxID=2953684 RepID=A0ABT2MPS0_9CYAN|nr:CBS domain-containing protein [Laspinema sp. D2a]
MPEPSHPAHPSMSINHSLMYSAALERAIDPNPPIVSPETSLEEVLALMSHVRSSCPLPSLTDSIQTNIWDSVRASCVLVLDGAPTVSEQLDAIRDTGKLPDRQDRILASKVGIFTERDIVKMTAAGVNLKTVKVSSVMTAPVVTLTESQSHDIFTILSVFRQHQIRHLPLIDHQGYILGILTPETIRQALQPVRLLTQLREVKDIMSPNVIQAPLNASVLELAKLMADRRVSCVVICQDAPETQTTYPPAKIPVGIVTERDLVQFQALQLDLGKMQAKDVMSSPLFSLSPQDSVWFAHEEMQRRRVRRLVVSSAEGYLLGLVSQTSLLQALHPTEMYGAIETLQEVVENRTKELQKANEQLQREIEERKRAEIALQKAHDNLQKLVEERTAELRATNAKLEQDIRDRQRVEAALRESEAQLRQQAHELESAMRSLQQTQFQLIQSEKMSSLGQLVAGVAHEINNPVNFIYGNLSHATQYIQDLLELIDLYQTHFNQNVPEIENKIEDIDLDFLVSDLPKMIASMQIGADRIRSIVLSLRNFSRLDEADRKRVDIHEGLDSTLLILQHRLKGHAGRREIVIVKEYGNLPKVDCYVGPLNQVFMNIITNAIDALEMGHSNNERSNGKALSKSPLSSIPATSPTIRIRTQVDEGDRITISIADNGPGMTETVRRRLFEPFFTTKPVGSATGLGLSISYQIVVEKHKGQLHCSSTPGYGTEFRIEIPPFQPHYEPPLFDAPSQNLPYHDS